MEPGPMMATESATRGRRCSSVRTASITGSSTAASAMDMPSGSLQAAKDGTTRYSENVPSRVMPRWRQLWHMFGTAVHAVRALTAAPGRIQADPVTLAEARDPGADAGDHARALVAHHHRDRHRDAARVLVLQDHHVAVAEAGRSHLDEDLARPRARDRQVQDLRRIRGVPVPSPAPAWCQAPGANMILTASPPRIVGTAASASARGMRCVMRRSSSTLPLRISRMASA